MFHSISTTIYIFYGNLGTAALQESQLDSYSTGVAEGTVRMQTHVLMFSADEVRDDVRPRGAAQNQEHGGITKKESGGIGVIDGVEGGEENKNIGN